MNDMEVDFGDVKKCAIFVHYSIDDVSRVEQMKKRLEEFCKETLKCDNYEFFIEIGSFEGERTVFNEMLNKFNKQEFSHLLVTNIGQIYKLTYDMNKAIDLTDKIQAMNVTIISVDEKRIIEGIEKLKESREKVMNSALYKNTEERGRRIKQGKINRKIKG